MNTGFVYNYADLLKSFVDLWVCGNASFRMHFHKPFKTAIDEKSMHYTQFRSKLGTI